MFQHAGSAPHFRLASGARLAASTLDRIRAGAVLLGSSLFAVTGVILWIALHMPLSESRKASVAYFLAGVWGVAQAGFHSEWVTAPARRRR